MALILMSYYYQDYLYCIEEESENSEYGNRSNKIKEKRNLIKTDNKITLQNVL